MPIGQCSDPLCFERNRPVASVQNDKVVAEAVHLYKGNHAAAYMAALYTLSNAGHGAWPQSAAGYPLLEADFAIACRTLVLADFPAPALAVLVSRDSAVRLADRIGFDGPPTNAALALLRLTASFELAWALEFAAVCLFAE
ncbi:MAG TPA: hypothetical protein VGR45_04125 [Stellaceae bacterium]|nr:hypothetical protein [Stellaceae bacterium]